MNNLLISSFVLLLVTGCTKLGEPITHPNNWTDPSSDDSHMAKITVIGTEGCKVCHGDDYLGGTSDVSCYQCHAGGISGHPAYSIWVGSSDSPKFHGKEELERCKVCHGDDYLGGTSDVSCYQCHAGGISGHPAYSIWVGSSDSPNFHGKEDVERCNRCHGDDYLGGTSDVSCYQCHAGGISGHPASSIWVDSPNNPNFHGKEDVERCNRCHGDDYLGGTSGVSCYQCHDGPGYGCEDFTPPTNHTLLQEDDDCAALHMPGFEDPFDSNCAICHGTDLNGGSGPSCFICHGNKWDDD